jgi:hypothetical protein
MILILGILAILGGLYATTALVSFLTSATFREPTLAKNLGAHIEVDSNLDLNDVQSLSDQAADGVGSSGFRIGAPLRIRSLSRGAAEIRYYVGTEKKSVLTFSVSFTTRNSRTLARSGVERALTRQTMFLGFLPAGPRELVSWGSYTAFMQNLAQRIQRADADARVAIVSGPGQRLGPGETIPLSSRVTRAVEALQDDAMPAVFEAYARRAMSGGAGGGERDPRLERVRAAVADAVGLPGVLPILAELRTSATRGPWQAIGVWRFVSDDLLTHWRFDPTLQDAFAEGRRALLADSSVLLRYRLDSFEKEIVDRLDAFEKEVVDRVGASDSQRPA